VTGGGFGDNDISRSSKHAYPHDEENNVLDVNGVAA